MGHLAVLTVIGQRRQRTAASFASRRLASERGQFRKPDGQSFVAVTDVLLVFAHLAFQRRFKHLKDVAQMRFQPHDAASQASSFKFFVRHGVSCKWLKMKYANYLKSIGRSMANPLAIIHDFRRSRSAESN
jgi:hypothetical protein